MMETIKVNMTPCEDIKTIHASQNDNEAREWGFELHNNGEKIDSSSISDQLVFKAYEGGTEEILPTNGSTPTTSPFKGDIKYPQGLLSDQEFLYRESPTEEDGLAWIKSIKGNTLVWNQQLLAPTANASSTASADGSFRANRCTFTYDSATHISTITALENAGTSGFVFGLANGAPLVVGHKYLQMCDVFSPKMFNFVIGVNGNVDAKNYLPGNRYNHVSTIREFTTGRTEFLFNFNNSNAWTGTETVYIKNAMLFDLTQMGLDISSPSDFTSLFPLPYYAYNQGTLLSFNGNSIRAVSKNQFDTQVVTTSYAGLTLTKTQGTIRAVYSGGSQYAGFNFYGAPVFTDTFLKGKYRLSFDVSGLDTQWTVGLRQGASFLGGGQAVVFSNDGHHSFTIDTEANPNCYLSFARTGNKTTAYDVTFSNIQLELGTTETSYEPYTSSTLSLPISTYFSNGMKSAGNVYDELTETKAMQRFERLTIDDFVATVGGLSGGGLHWADYDNASVKLNGSAICNQLPVDNATAWLSTTPVVQIGTSTNRVRIYGTFTTLDELRSQYPNLEIYFELATPIETSFTTASLVTENAEIPLSNEDGVLIGKCTEQLSAEPGFHDAKIKLSDSDGECYSNKIQLHIERRPS